MAVIAKNIVPSTLLDATVATLYTVPAVTRAVIQKATVTNLDTVARTVTVHLVPSGGTAADTNAILKAYPVPANFTLDLPDLGSHVLEPGATIQALGSAASVLSLRVSGVEVV